MPEATDQTAIAFGRSCSLKIAGSTLKVSGITMAPPRPMKARNPIRLPADQA